jgi:hypothetical protein
MSSKDVALRKHIRLQDLFERVFVARATPTNAAMFANDPSHKEFGFYFSPEAVRIFDLILETFGAAECDAPPKSETSLLVGHRNAWQMLGPDA